VNHDKMVLMPQTAAVTLVNHDKMVLMPQTAAVIAATHTLFLCGHHISSPCWWFEVVRILFVYFIN
jgi:hypothetical protein